MAAIASIRVQPCPACSSCGSDGELLYEGLDDVLFGAPGEWSMRQCANSACRLLWLDPQPIESDIGLAYARYYTHGAATAGASLPARAFRELRSAYLSNRLGYGSSAPRWLGHLGVLYPGGGEALAASAMFLRAPRPGAGLLDVGCGRGDFLVTMRGRGWQVSGVEVDPAAVAQARARSLDVAEGSLREAHYKDAAFDAVTLAHVIEHVHDVAALLAECRRVLKPGGELVVLTPNGRSWGHRHFGRDWRGLEPPRHIRVFNAPNFRRAIISAGLVPARIETLAINARSTWAASRSIRAARAAGKNGAAPSPFAAIASGIVRQLAERVMLRFDADAGEDLLAISRRPA